MAQPSTAKEEYFENDATGVEAEVEDEPTIEKPWNPDEIRVNTKSWAVRNILDMIDDSDLDIAPVFPRASWFRVIFQ